jgi:hypothetical protein
MLFGATRSDGERKGSGSATSSPHSPLFRLHGYLNNPQGVCSQNESLRQLSRTRRDMAGTPTLEQVGFKTRYENGQNRGSAWWGLAYEGGSLGGDYPAVFYRGPLPFSMNIYRLDQDSWTYAEG